MTLAERWVVQFPDDTYVTRDRDFYGIGSRAFSPSEIYAGRSNDLSRALVSARMNALNLASTVGRGAVAVDTVTGEVKALGRSGRSHATKKRRAPAQLDREIAQNLASKGQAQLAALYGQPPSDHARRRGHSTKATSNGLFAVEIDRSVFDGDRDLPAGARWREDLAHLAEKELGRGRTYRRPVKARYDVIEWTGYRGEIGKLLDWMEAAPGITRYAEIFE
jgi:hypothetical protein